MIKKIFAIFLNKPVFLLAIICLVLTIIWFRNGNIFGGAEEGLKFNNLDLISSISSKVWIDQYLGMPSIGEPAKLPYFGLMKIINDLGVSNFILQALTFYLILFSSSVSVYFLVKKMLPIKYDSQDIALTAAFFYLFNPYSMSQVWFRGLYSQSFFYAYLPAFFLMFILGLYSNSYKFVFFASIVSFFFSAAMANPAYPISIWTVILLYFCLFVLKNLKENVKIKSAFRYFFVFCLSWVLINFWWISIYLMLATKTYLVEGSGFDNNLESLKLISAQNSWLSILRLYHNLHFMNLNLYGDFFQGYLMKLISYFPLVVVFFAIPKIKKINLIFFGILFIIGILISLGSNPPFGRIFVLFFNKIPYLQVFRNPYEKFGIVYLLAYSTIFALGFNYLFKKLKHFSIKYFPRFHFLLLFIYFFLSLIYFGVFLFPMWTGKTISWGNQAKVPEYYLTLNSLQKQINPKGDYLFFLPLMNDFGVSYIWDGKTYSGIDPLYQLVNAPIISGTGRNEFLINLRANLGQINPSPVLSLIRANTLILREDVQSTKKDQKQAELFIQRKILPGGSNQLTIVCQNILSEDTLPARAKCQIPKIGSDFSSINYLRFEFASNTTSALEIFIQDSTGSKVRWDGKSKKDLQYSPLNPGLTKFNTFTISLSDPTDNAEINYSNIKSIELITHPLPNSNQMPTKFILKRVLADLGVEIPLDEYQLESQTQGLKIYKPKHLYSVPEVIVVNKVIPVKNYLQLFTSAEIYRTNLQKIAFVITDQISSKDQAKFASNSAANLKSVEKISNTKYKLTTEGLGKKYLVLNKSFNPFWKVIPIQNQNYRDDLLTSLKLLFLKSIHESNHFKINGFANFWVDESDNKIFLIVYTPQIIMDLGFVISIVSLSLMGICFMIPSWKKPKFLN